ncbi:MAG: hypothetical protein HYY06_30105 [Deltaproteobacteria bacterium]|nr:hypothetical protein [Deltaproteobacteria bacterium]
MSAHELAWSSFLREPTSVERWLRHGDVLLRRRDGQTLRLSRESSETAQREALLAAVRLLTVGASRAKKKLQIDEAEIAERLPWTRFLPAADRTTFVAEFLDTLESCADLGEFVALGRLVEDWKATASLHAEGLAGRLKGGLRGTGARVPRP